MGAVHIGIYPLKSSIEPIKHFIIFCRDNRYRCTYLSESRTTTAATSTPKTSASVRLPCRPTNSCGYQQGESSPYLVSRVLLVELDFRTTGYLSATTKYQALRTMVESTCPVVPLRYPARAPLGHPTPYLQGHQSVQVPTNK